MDYSSLLVFVGFIVVSALVVMIISFFGTREKTYEEAIAEQKQKAQEIALQTKTEKPVKEKKKKHVRKYKEKGDKENEKEDLLTVPVYVAQTRSVSESSDKVYKPKHAQNPSRKVLQVDNVNHAKEPKDTNLNRDTEYAVSETKPIEVTAPVKKQEKKEKREELRAKPPAEEKAKDVLKTDEKEKSKGSKGGRITEEAKNKDEIIVIKKENETKGKSKSQARGDEEDDGLESMIASKREEKENVKNNNKTEMKTELSAPKKDDAHATSSPAKKKKSKSEFGYGDGVVNGTRLVGVMKNAILTDSEMQTLIEILLNRQQEGESWVKPGQKSDPISNMKKQLQETEQALDNEKQLSQSTSSKLKEVRQELSRATQMERSLREKVTSVTQELQVLQAHLQQTVEQHTSEIGRLQVNFQQVQGKMEEEHRSTVQRLQEENDQLQAAIAQLEAETNDVTSAEIARMQHEVEQWRATTEQLQSQLATAQHAEHELVLQQQRIQDLENNKTQCETVLEQRIGDLMNQLQQLEMERNSVQTELCHMQTIQTENASLHNQVHCMEKEIHSYQQSIQDLNTQLLQATDDNKHYIDPETENRLAETTNELEHLQDEIKNNKTLIQKLKDDTEQKDSRISQLQEDITKFTDDVQRLTNEVETHREKNNALREKNWKAMDALSLAEKNAEEKVRLADKRIRERIAEEVVKEQDNVRTVLQRIFPDISQASNLEFHDWLQRLESDAKTLTAPSSTNDSDELKKEISEAKETESTLRSQVQQYKDILQDTESMLHRLQRSVEEEESTWKERLLGKEAELTQLLEDKKILEEEKSALENSLEEIRAAEEMQEKLKELQAKLQGEENERRLLEIKYTEAGRNTSDLQKQLEETRKELELVRTAQMSVDEQKRELEIQLDKEKKHTKDLTTNNVKLNSLVRIGQDSLKAEQDVVNELQNQLSELKKSTTNGSACPAGEPIEPDNKFSENDMLKSSPDSPSFSPFKSKSKKRAASNKK